MATETYHWKCEWYAEEDGKSVGPFWVVRDGQCFYPLGHVDKVWVSIEEATDYANVHGGELVEH